MNLKLTSLQSRLYLVAAIVLLVGVGSAVCIYLAAENVSESSLVYQFENSKRYRHDLELMGGKMSVLADGFFRWFDGLWHGKSLVFTVAFIALFISSGFFFVAGRLPAYPESIGLSDKNQNRVE